MEEKLGIQADKSRAKMFLFTFCFISIKTKTNGKEFHALQNARTVNFDYQLLIVYRLVEIHYSLKKSPKITKELEN